MADVCVKYARTPDAIITDFQYPGIAELTIDQSGIAQEARISPCKEFFAASLLCCYVGSFGSAILARKATYTRISGTAVPEVGMNATNQARITGVTLNVRVEAPAAHKDTVEHCLQVMRNGCLVTASVHDCVKITYNVELVFTDELV